MTKLMNIAQRFREEEDGAAMVEYSILIGIITAASIGLIIGVGKYVTTSWTGLCDNLNKGTAGSCAKV